MHVLMIPDLREEIFHVYGYELPLPTTIPFPRLQCGRITQARARTHTDIWGDCTENSQGTGINTTRAVSNSRE